MFHFPVLFVYLHASEFIFRYKGYCIRRREDMITVTREDKSHILIQALCNVLFGCMEILVLIIVLKY
jgi:hypothetical protein